ASARSTTNALCSARAPHPTLRRRRTGSAAAHTTASPSAYALLRRPEEHAGFHRHVGTVRRDGEVEQGQRDHVAVVPFGRVRMVGHEDLADVIARGVLPDHLGQRHIVPIIAVIRRRKRVQLGRRQALAPPGRLSPPPPGSARPSRARPSAGHGAPSSSAAAGTLRPMVVCSSVSPDSTSATVSLSISTASDSSPSVSIGISTSALSAGSPDLT